MTAKKDRVVVSFGKWLEAQLDEQPLQNTEVAYDAAIELKSDPAELPGSLRSQQPRVGLDIGHAETRVILPGRDSDRAPRTVTLPTWLGYSPDDNAPVRHTSIGNRALSRRHRMDLVNPLRVGPHGDAQVWGDFAAALRSQYEDSPDDTRTWGVISCSASATDEEKMAKRAIGNELFDRVVLVDHTFLVALGLDCQAVQQNSIVVDIGATSIRATRMEGTTPKPEHCVVVDFGGDRLDEELRLGLALRYPELLLTDHTLVQIKERLSFAPPVQRRSILSVFLGGAERHLDLTDVVRQSCELLAQNVVRAIREVISRCPSDRAEELQQNIILVGGGAEVRGIATRAERDLHRDGFELASLQKPVNSGLLAAKGAYRWAQQLEADQWNIPLFSFGEGA